MGEETIKKRCRSDWGRVGDTEVTSEGEAERRRGGEGERERERGRGRRRKQEKEKLRAQRGKITVSLNKSHSRHAIFASNLPGKGGREEEGGREDEGRRRRGTSRTLMNRLMDG